MDPSRPDSPAAPAPPGLLIGAWRDLREVLAIAFPVIVAMASHTLMTFVDTRMLAGYGMNELAAVGAAGAVAFTIIAFMFGTAGCTSTFVSQSMGRGMPVPDPAKGSRTIFPSQEVNMLSTNSTGKDAGCGFLVSWWILHMSPFLTASFFKRKASFPLEVFGIR